MKRGYAAWSTLRKRKVWSTAARYEAKPWQASYFLCQNFGKKNGGEGVTPEPIVFSAYLTSKVIDYQVLIPVFL